MISVESGTCRYVHKWGEETTIFPGERICSQRPLNWYVSPEMIAGVLVSERYSPVEKSPVNVNSINGRVERASRIMKSREKDIIMVPRMNAEGKLDKY